MKGIIVELIASLIIIGVLTAIAVPIITAAIERATEAQEEMNRLPFPLPSPPPR